jgi:hypothetical protein
MINGAFGVGKTTVATELVKGLENSMLFDPEEVGFMLRTSLPEEIKQREAPTGDFQDFDLWKDLTVTVAKKLVENYNVNVIVPMTIWNPEYFHYISNGFREIDGQTHHFCLMADRETIFTRLRRRGEAEGNWCFQQTEKCLKSFKENDFRTYIDTEHVEVETVINRIKEKLPFSRNE